MDHGRFASRAVVPMPACFPRVTAMVLFVAAALLELPSGPAPSTAAPSAKGSSLQRANAPASPAVVTDPSLILTVPLVSKPGYLTTIMDPVFGSPVERVGNNVGASTTPLSGTWGSDARHVYSKQEPWNSDGTLIVIENRSGGSPTPMILDGTTYAPKYGPCPSYNLYDYRWNPSPAHPHEQINVDPTGRELMWFDVVNCIKTRSWALPITVDYGIGSGEGNPSHDGRFVALGNNTAMFVVDMDPQPPYAPYPNVRIGPVYSYPPESLTTSSPNTWTVDNLSISPSGKYVDVKFGSADDCGSYDMHRIFEVDPGTLALKPHNMATASLRCCTFQGRPNGWIYPLKHADMALDPFDNNEDVIVGGRSCPNATIGHVVKVRLRDGQLTPLTDGVNESSVYHVSTRNLDRPGWAYVSWFKVDGRRYSDEITAIKLDGSGSVERLCHMHTAASGCYRCEAHPAPSRDGVRVIFASNWDEDCGSGCGSASDIKDYVVIDTAAIVHSPRIQEWPTDSTSSLPVCLAANVQNNEQMAPDGAGGAFLVWEDSRAGASAGVHVYAQHLTATGAIAPGWPVDGAAICTTGTGQSRPAVVADGAGGAMFVWFDSRGPGNLYAQRVGADGVPAWTDGGITLGTATRGSAALTGGPPSLLSDGAGGAFVVWNDTRSPNAGVYLQYVTQSGNLMWNDTGLGVITRAGGQSSARITSDGAGGMFIAWQDSRAGNADIYAQHLSGDGTVRWLSDGIPVCTAAGSQAFPAIVDDRNGGAFVGWQDFRADTAGDTYLEHLVAAGVDPVWTHDGVALAASQLNAASAPMLIPDAQGNALCAWTDSRIGTIAVQRVNRLGSVQWASGGIPVTRSASFLDAAVADGANGLIVLYERRPPLLPADLRAQRVSDLGAPMWGPDGVAIASAPRNQNNAVAVTDGADGAILAWHDARSDTGDVYAQNVESDGTLGGSVTPVLISLVSADALDGSVALKWYSGQGALAAVHVSRTTDGNSWSALGTIAADAEGMLSFEDQAVVAGERYGYRLGIPSGSSEEFSAVTWVTVPQTAAFSLGPWENPVLTQATLRFALPATGRVRLDLLDVQGRVIETLVDGDLAAGEHLVQLNATRGGKPISAGVYLARLKAGGHRLTRRLILLK